MPLLPPRLPTNSVFEQLQRAFLEHRNHGRSRKPTTQVHGCTFIESSPSAGTSAAGTTAVQIQAQAIAALQAHYGAVLHAAFTKSPFKESVPPPKYAGIKLGEIIAWRRWRVENGWLYSVWKTGAEWEPGKIMEAHKVNTVEGGIHAFKTRKQAIDYDYSCPQGTYVVGRVELWGEVIEFERGWHAGFAKVHSVDLVVENRVSVPTDQGAPIKSCRVRCDADRLVTLRETYGLGAT